MTAAASKFRSQAKKLGLKKTTTFNEDEPQVLGKSLPKAKFAMKSLARLPETFAASLRTRSQEYGLILEDEYMDDYEYDGNAPLGKSLFAGMVRNRPIPQKVETKTLQNVGLDAVEGEDAEQAALLRPKDVKNMPYTLAAQQIIVTCHELNLTTLGVEQHPEKAVPFADHLGGFDWKHPERGQGKLTTGEIVQMPIERGSKVRVVGPFKKELLQQAGLLHYLTRYQKYQDKEGI